MPNLEQLFYTILMRGIVQEIRTRVTAEEGGRLAVGYDLVLDDATSELSAWQGLVLRRVGDGLCRACQTPLAKGRAREGREYYYDCFSTLARCDLCVMSPDRCHFHLGTCREPEWAQDFCMQPHTVYLALSHVPKVGITRQGREWYRWADQGAAQAMKLISVPTRRMAGVLEAYLSQWVTDRTDWRKLVTGQKRPFDLMGLATDLRHKSKVFVEFTSDQTPSSETQRCLWLEDEPVYELEYPIRSFAPAEQIRIEEQHEDQLLGIVGGYLLLSQGVVATSTLTRGDIEIERKDNVVLKEKPQMSLF